MSRSGQQQQPCEYDQPGSLTGGSGTAHAGSRREDSWVKAFIFLPSRLQCSQKGYFIGALISRRMMAVWPVLPRCSMYYPTDT